MSNKSIIFITPDYHCSFFHRDELRKLGWKADIYVGKGYPSKLLYSDQDILRCPNIGTEGLFGRVFSGLIRFGFFISLLCRYKYHFYYCGIDQFGFFEVKLGLRKLFGDSFRIHLWLSKLFKRKIIQNPSGCNEFETRANFSKLDGGNVCNNCGWPPDACNDKKNTAQFDLVRKYADLVLGYSVSSSSQFKTIDFKYKAIDLELWKPDLVIPEEFKLYPTENFRVMHAFYKQGREHNGKNIKGSPFILDAINRLKQEGYRIEYYYVTDAPSNVMRYYQVQADVIVENLIYGWWGSTAIEGMALGKPVVCYLRPAWKAYFLNTYPEYQELPIVEADTATIYNVLKRLVTDHQYRVDMGNKSRQFAKQHFDPRQNAKTLSDLFLQL